MANRASAGVETRSTAQRACGKQSPGREGTSVRVAFTEPDYGASRYPPGWKARLGPAPARRAGAKETSEAWKRGRVGYVMIHNLSGRYQKEAATSCV